MNKKILLLILLSVLLLLPGCLDDEEYDDYNINGKNHPNARELAIYYPLHIMGSSELKIFSDVCISPYYLSLVDMVASGYSEEGYCRLYITYIS